MLDQSELSALEAQFMAAVRAYVASLVEQTILDKNPSSHSTARKDALFIPNDPRRGRDDNPPGNR
jgi:hypothetical protein